MVAKIKFKLLVRKYLAIRTLLFQKMMRLVTALSTGTRLFHSIYGIIYVLKGSARVE